LAEFIPIEDCVIVSAVRIPIGKYEYGVASACGGGGLAGTLILRGEKK